MTLLRINSNFLNLIKQSREKKKRYTDLSADELLAYQTVHSTLESLGKEVLQRLGGTSKFVMKLTAGFTPNSGVRGSLPKDLWFAVYPKENEKRLAANPQVFMIASERGLEYGFGAAVHPGDFSNKDLKKLVRATAPKVFDILPQPNSTEAALISDKIEESGYWYFRKKHRLEADQSDFASFTTWLQFLQSPEGKKNAAGTISRYLTEDEINQTNLKEEILNMTNLFKPLLERDWYDAVENLKSRDFAEKLGQFLTVFEEKREKSYAIDDNLRSAMEGVQTWLEHTPAIVSRQNLKVKMSVGNGGWTKTPWIAIMDNRITTSTQSGVYVVFLIAEDLSVTYLTLNQGTTNLINTHGQRGAVEEMQSIAKDTRSKVQDLLEEDFSLDSNIQLKSKTSNAKNYEKGTIVWEALPTNNIPDDRSMHGLLETLLTAYERIINADSTTSTQPIVEPDVMKEYKIKHALNELFLEQKDVERYLDIWRSKKNLILQGAPGVGKSYLAKILAYTLIGFEDDQKVESVQFHQSYSYEDFVQGYRPNGTQGFERKNGSFFEFRNKAVADPDGKYVFIIDEINRGNLSKIFGELMLLIEPDKRVPKWATKLSYAGDGESKFYVPSNLFILGMMNTADKSLSMVDYALRRRFAFVTLAPQFTAPKYRTHLIDKGVSEELVGKIISKMGELNKEIEDDRLNLGPGYRIGHSFFTPSEKIISAEFWYKQIVNTEIYPLLEEYWFDSPEQADQWCEQLLR